MLTCRACGDDMFLDENEVSHHAGDGPTGIDHDKDADHTAIADEAPDFTGPAPERLYKTTIVAWTRFDPTGAHADLSGLVREVEQGGGYFTREDTVPVATAVLGADEDVVPEVFGFFGVPAPAGRPEDDECDDRCVAHRPDCDGYCDHWPGHRNACWITPTAGAPVPASTAPSASANQADPVQDILARLTAVSDGEDGDEEELALLRDLRDAVAATASMTTSAKPSGHARSTCLYCRASITADGGPAIRRPCGYCRSLLTADGRGSWVDDTDGDGCDNPTGVHSPSALPVTTTVRSDDGVRSETVDAADYFASTDDYGLLALAGPRNEFGPGDATDLVAWQYESLDPLVAAVLAHCAERTAAGEECGFSVQIDAAQARAWIATYRPHLNLDA